MKFLVDAQLPERLSRQLVDAGHDVLHTSQLADGNRTTDQEIVRLADEQDRVVVSKDRDFRDSHLLRGAPRRLLVVSTGNISNDDLLALFNQHLTAVVAAFGERPWSSFDPESWSSTTTSEPVGWGRSALCDTSCQRRLELEGQVHDVARRP